MQPEKKTYKQTSIKLSSDFSKENLQARREWQNTLKVLKEKNLQPKILYLEKLPFRIE